MRKLVARGVAVRFSAEPAVLAGVRDFVLCVARLEPCKNQLMLLEAMRDDPRPLVLVGGRVTYYAEYVALCRAFRRSGPTLILERLLALEANLMTALLNGGATGGRDDDARVHQ